MVLGCTIKVFFTLVQGVRLFEGCTKFLHYRVYDFLPSRVYDFFRVLQGVRLFEWVYDFILAKSAGCTFIRGCMIGYSIIITDLTDPHQRFVIHSPSLTMIRLIKTRR